MQRRASLATGLGAAVCTMKPIRAAAETSDSNPGQGLSQGGKLHAIAPGNFPFEYVVTNGENALLKWNDLKKTSGISPIVVGSRSDLEALVEGMDDATGADINGNSTSDVLKKADALKHPKDLREMREQETANACSSIKKSLSEKSAEQMDIRIVSPDGTSRRMTEQEMLANCDGNGGPEVGYWPSVSPDPFGLTVVEDVSTGQPLKKTYIALIPTDDWTTIPAHIKWGGWNANPAAEYHVAALRSWRDRYGAELVGLNGSTMNLRVANSPQTREEAIELAREHYTYCYDIIDQGAETLSNLAAYLKARNWWYFWWD